MDQQPDSGGLIALPATEFEASLERASETGARRALREVGLDGQDAAEDIRDLRSLLAGFRIAKQTAVQTVEQLMTTGVMLALLAGNGPDTRRSSAVRIVEQDENRRCTTCRSCLGTTTRTCAL